MNRRSRSLFGARRIDPVKLETGCYPDNDGRKERHPRCQAQGLDVTGGFTGGIDPEVGVAQYDFRMA